MLKHIALTLAMLSFVCLAVAAADPAPAEAPKPAFEATFDATEDADPWTPVAPWIEQRQEGVAVKLAVGEAYGKDGKGLLLQNVQDAEFNKKNLLRLAAPLPDVTGKPAFTIEFDYRMPKAKNAAGRVDVGLNEAGWQKFFIMTGHSVGFIYEEGKDEKGKPFAKYARVGTQPGEWYRIKAEIDQANQRFRVSVNDKIVPCGDGEWAKWRYNRPADIAKPKQLYFTCRANWPDCIRHFDNIRVTVPAQVKAE